MWISPRLYGLVSVTLEWAQWLDGDLYNNAWISQYLTA